jgi:xanthine dehydrogenase accessory factor
MKELIQIINVYQKAKLNHQSVALATVVMVNGSAYRRPGARMLINETGEFTGAISGGCLEGDALKKAQLVIFQQKSMVVTYDTTDEDDQKFGIGLGCNGIIQILIEPIQIFDPLNPVELLIKSIQESQNFALTTFFSIHNALEEQIGTRLYGLNQEFIPDLNPELAQLFKQNLEYQSPILSTKKLLFNLNQKHYAFVERFHQQFNVVIFGAGNDVIPLVNMLDLLGYPPVLIDGRANYANKNRFPNAKEIIISSAEEAFESYSLGANDFVLLMTHNFEYEAKILQQIIELNVPYIGVLGPKKKTFKLLERLNLPLSNEFIVSKNIYAPIGLDLGAESSEEIAVSIVSEILAVLNRKLPSFLRNKIGPIHDDEQPLETKFDT